MIETAAQRGYSSKNRTNIVQIFDILHNISAILSELVVYDEPN